ncbi:kinesin-like protein KIN-12B [Malus sylvestris]|uniref:kinesin-like protein KIN-12B n=1 Tax=Malus sylvestris TaxID=3752 RepID=UPI0021AD2FFA|nr:kinesin-like protein KIN-12B [Malus sylvestris]
MKHFMQPRNTILRETTEPPSSPNPSSVKAKPPRKPKASKENTPPSDLSSMISDSKPSPAAKLKSPLPPRPPSSNPLKRKLSVDSQTENSAAGTSDSGVQVVVRMRPPRKDKDEGDMMVQKLSSDSLSINGQTFTFDSVCDADASQLDIFQLVGAPLVENCMAGFNSSVFAYGQTGSGKTYTMWGPANALMDENLSSDQQGLTPRVLEHLFARLNEEQIKHADKELKYQCHCSFLEIYNEQITDLLDPNQKSLQIREDVKSGVYVENLTEECVRTIKDVTQLLIKGLSNRRTGSTSINAESSRSHTVFTCVVESQCKNVTNGISFKTSRINLVDLAGSERQKLTGAAGERLKEAGNINRSLSQLGNLINILAEISQTGKQRHIPYRDSRLTFLLQESLGGNAKLAMVCAISPTQSCKSETFSTLRFAQRAKAIKNKAVVNEVMQEDVNQLREVIRQLRDELRRIKAHGNNPAASNGGHSAAWFRQSLNMLKASLKPTMTLPHVDDDSDEDMEIDEEAVERLCAEVSNQTVVSEANRADVNSVETMKSHSQLVAVEIGSSEGPQNHASGSGCIKEQGVDTDVNMEEGISEQEGDMIVECGTSTPVIPSASASDIHNLIEDTSMQPVQEENILRSSISDFLIEESACKSAEKGSSCAASDPPGSMPGCLSVADECIGSSNGSVNCVSPCLSIVPCDAPQVLKSPTPSVSPRVNASRKSLRTSSMLTASQKDLTGGSTLSPDSMHISLAKPAIKSSPNDLSAQTCNNFSAPTEQLAASIRHGLEIIGSHRQSSALRKSSFRFSLKPSESRVIVPVSKADVGVQTSQEIVKEGSVEFMCSNCKNRMQLEVEANEIMQLVPVDGSESADKSKIQVPKAVEKVLAGAIRREMALEDICAKKTSEIMQLNRLVQQYKYERECNGIIAQTREDKILRLESLMDGVLPTEEFMEEELVSLTHEYKLLKEKYENHPELLRTNIELKRVQDELENLRNFCDMGEREVLLEEIQDLRSQLQYYVDCPSTSARTRNSMMKLTHSRDPNVVPLSTISESNEESSEHKLEQERQEWNEVESKWISLAEELRMELEASRSLAEKTMQELETEKKCADELKEAIQLAMEGQSRMLEQYADLEEKHMQLLARHRMIRDGVEDVKKAAAKAGVRGAESKFINAIAAEISALRVERERERRYLRDENKGLQAQLRDTAEAVQAAGELLVRLKEADEAVATAQKQAMEAKQEADKAYMNIEKLKKKHEKEISSLNELIAESRLPKEATQPAYDGSNMAKYDAGEPHSLSDQRWREEFEPFYNGEEGELRKLAQPSSWFSGYDRCNI